jgi:hypothetical protein
MPVTFASRPSSARATFSRSQPRRDAGQDEAEPLPDLQPVETPREEHLGKDLGERWAVGVVQLIDGPHRVRAEDPDRLSVQAELRDADRDVLLVERDRPELIVPRLRRVAIRSPADGVEVEEELPVEDESKPPGEAGTFLPLVRRRDVVEV